MTEPAASVTTPTVSPTPAPTANPFPDAMAPGTYQEWRSGNMTLKGTVIKTILADYFEYHSISWGQWLTERPKNTSVKYLFVFLKLENGGPDVGRMPSPAMFTLISNGSEYAVDTGQETVEFDKSTGKMVPVPIRISGQDVYESDYQNVYGAGYLYAGESNAVNAYLIYLVPAAISLDDTYLQAVFTSTSTGVWKLGAGPVREVTAAPTTVTPAVTRTAVPVVQSVPYTEVYRDSGYYMYYQNGKKTFSYTLMQTPLVIKYTLVPEIVSDIKITGPDTNMKEIPVNYTDPDSWFRVTVKKAGTGDIVLREGFGNGLDQDSEKTVLVRSPGSYDILLEGNKINVTVVMSVPAS
jgi:hypothetical protein